MTHTNTQYRACTGLNATFTFEDFNILSGEQIQLIRHANRLLGQHSSNDEMTRTEKNHTFGYRNAIMDLVQAQVVDNIDMDAYEGLVCDCRDDRAVGYFTFRQWMFAAMRYIEINGL